MTMVVVYSESSIPRPSLRQKSYKLKKRGEGTSPVVSG